MPIYLYHCGNCDLKVDIVKPMAKASNKEFCAICGSEMERKFTPIPDSFGWRLTQDSHDMIRRDMIQGGKDKIERNV